MPETNPNERHNLARTGRQLRRGYERIFNAMLPRLVELGQPTLEAGPMVSGGEPTVTPITARGRSFGYHYNGFRISEDDMRKRRGSSGGNKSVYDFMDIPASDEKGSHIGLKLFDRASEEDPSIGFTLQIERSKDIPNGVRQEMIEVREGQCASYSAQSIIENPDYDKDAPLSPDNYPVSTIDVTPEMELDSSALRALVGPIYHEAAQQIRSLH